MKVAIHHRENSFSNNWIDYCLKESIDYKIVSFYSNNIIEDIKDCDVILWHHHHLNYEDRIIAKQILLSLELSGKMVFPDYRTCWHFDDKIGQKYLLESIEAPVIPTYIFYNLKDALEWAKRTNYPKVFKLRGGAGSQNVKIVTSYNSARKIIRQSFGRGFRQFDSFQFLKERIHKYKNGKSSLLSIIKGTIRLFYRPEFARMLPNEKGYVYFQDFIPNLKFDFRVIVIADKAFAIKRIVRENDFRASGSGNIIYDKEQIPTSLIDLGFKLNEKLKTQCVAFDFIFDESKCPRVIEISYGFTQIGYDNCPGFWDKDLNYHHGKFIPQDWMIKNLLNID